MAGGTDSARNRTLTIDGHAIEGIPSFYEEINRVFMADEDWKIGSSLDALNDLFHGGFGALQGKEPVALIWRDMDRSRAALGLETTRKFYREKLKRPEMFDSNRISRELEALESGTGPTYFEIILQIIADHPNIELIAA